MARGRKKTTKSRYSVFGEYENRELVRAFSDLLYRKDEEAFLFIKNKINGSS